MSRRSLSAEWTLTEALEANRAFDRKIAETIITEVGTPIRWQPRPAGEKPRLPFSDLDGPDALAWYLNEIGFAVRQDQTDQSRPNLAKVTGKVERVRRACANLLAASKDESGGIARELREVPGVSIEIEKMVVLVTNVEQRLVAEAVNLKRQHERRGRTTRRGAPKDHAWHLMIERLAHAYRRLWHEEPGLSRKLNDEPTGPFFRLVKAVATVLGTLEGRTDEALAQSIKSAL